MSTQDLFLRELRDDGVLVLTFNNPTRRNPLSHQAVEALKALCREVNADARIKVLVMTGAGSAFSAGADLASLQQTGLKSAHELLDWYPNHIQQLPQMLVELHVPTIAAVNGPALGIGFDLACMFDIRIAAASATFAESFIALGLVPGDGGAWLSQQACGYASACELAFTGEPVSAERALAMGLVSQVVPDGQALPAALKLAERMARRPAGALRMTKALMRAARTQGLQEVLRLSAALQVTAHASDEHRHLLQSAIDALAAKRAQRETAP